MIQDPRNTQFLSQGGAHVHEPHTSASWVTNEGEALFAFATNIGSILLVKLPPVEIQGIATQHELRQASMMQRLWTGLVPSMIRGGQEASDAVLSLFIHPVGQELLIFTICRDHKVRVWSCKDYECVTVCDILEYIPNSEELQNAAATNHVIRKSLGSSSTYLQLAVYLGFEDRSQFCVFQPVLEDGQYRLLSLASIDTQNDSLIDFSLTDSEIWAVFTTTDGQTAIRSISYDDGMEGTWDSVMLHNIDVVDIPIPPLQDPREAYVEFIFHQSGFSSHAVAKTLSNILKQPVDSRRGLDVLKQEVITAMEIEVQKASRGYELPLDEYFQVQLQCWKTFCSNCSQYQEVVDRPVGLFIDQNTGLIVYLKKGNVSLLRPMDPIEQLYISHSTSPPDLTLAPLYCDELHLDEDILTLFKCIRLVSENVSKEMKAGFQFDICQSEPPENMAQEIACNLLVQSSNNIQSTSSAVYKFERELQDYLQGMMEPIKAIERLLCGIDVAQGMPEALSMEESVMDTGRHIICSHLFASEHSAVILSEVLKQTSFQRFQLCSDLMILMYLMQKIDKQMCINPEGVNQLELDLIPKTSTCLLAYHSVYWLCCCQSSQPETNTVESSLRQFVALEITHSSGINAACHLESSCGSLVEVFLHGIGGTQLRISLTNSNHIREDSNETWNCVLLPAISALARLIWPISSSFLFCEFLLGKCQYVQLQEYIQLLSDWCEWNTSSRHFLLGQCYLNCNEPYKAVECFQLASHGVVTDEFLLNKLIQTDDGDTKALQVIYYLKVLRLLEQFNIPNLVISLAKTALSIADDEDPNIPSLWSKIFKHHLELRHNQEAYVAMTANPDPIRRKDCLRQFIVVLFERSQLQQLCEFPYIDLEDEFVSIVESRARSVDLRTQKYYEFLYAFHVYRGNHRKAGSVMYEYGLRAGREIPGLQGLQRQVKCYVAAINSLHLVNPRHAWITKPSPANIQQDIDVPGMSPKRNYDGEMIEHSPMTKHIEVLEIGDLQKEYMLASARLKLIQYDPDAGFMAGPVMSAEETVSMLVKTGLFDTAISICNNFNLAYSSVFEALVSKCCHGSSDSYAWNWLTVNDTSHLSSTTEIRASELSWRLLEYYFQRLDSDGENGYRKVVASKLLSLGVPLPCWLIHSYKRKNTPELLQLYINFDLLEEATNLALEFIDAVLGKGKEHFGLKSCLQGSQASNMWLPYTAIDQLLYILKESKGDPHFQQLYHALNDKLKVYFTTTESVSEDMERTCRLRAKQIMQERLIME
ncbi:nuclear pore complex protein Nup160-like [Glandiceps talaboti]